MKYSIVIPAKDEENRIGATIESLMEAFPKDAEIIVVDDGSKDKTSDVAKSYGLKVLRHDVNRGKGAAVKTGFLNAMGEVVGFVDADGSTDARDARKVFDLVGEYDVVIASRRIKGATIPEDQGALRKTFGWALRQLVNALFGLHIVDSQCGCKAMKSGIAKKIAPEMKRNGFDFDVELLYKAKKRGKRIKEVGVRWTNRGESKVSPLRDSLRILVGLLKIRMAG